MIRRLLCALACVPVVLLGWLSTIPTASATSTAPAVTYAYDSPAHAGVPTHTRTERGSPAASNFGTIYNFVGHWSRGGSSRPSIGAPFRAAGSEIVK